MGHSERGYRLNIESKVWRFLIVQWLDEQPYQVRVESPQARILASALVEREEVDSVTVGDDGSVTFTTRRLSVVEAAIPSIAKERGIRLLRVEPLDDSLESVFSYVVER